MDQNISEYSPSNTQALLRMVEALVAGYRNGGNDRWRGGAVGGA
jgi:hypothetical protein